MKKIIYGFTLLLIFSSSAIANNSKTYKELCLSKAQKYDIKMVKQKNGYQLVEYKGKIYVLIIDSDMVMPKNSCNNKEIPLFLQP